MTRGMEKGFFERGSPMTFLNSFYIYSMLLLCLSKIAKNR